jgi:hypothetical protein
LEDTLDVPQEELHLRRSLRCLLLVHPSRACSCRRGLLEALELVQEQLEVGGEGVLEKLLLLGIGLHHGRGNGRSQGRQGRGEHAAKTLGGIFPSAHGGGEGKDLVGIGCRPAPEDVGVLQLLLVLVLLLVQAMVVVVVGGLEAAEVVGGLVVAVQGQACRDQNVAGGRHDAGSV